MAIKRALRLTNRRVRLLVGLLLAALFCIQCTRNTGAGPEPAQFATAIDGQLLGKTHPDRLAKLVELAKTDHIALLELCRKHVQAQYQDYTCTLTKHEIIRGVDKKQQKMLVKHRAKPYSVALAWTQNAPMGDRVLYVEGKYDNNMLVRPTNGFLRALCPTAKRKPDGDDAMKSTLRPVNMFGFDRGLESLIEVYVQARDRGELTKTEFGGFAEVGGRKALKLIRYLPPNNDYPAWKTITYIDVETLVPVCVEAWDWDKKFSCQYLYEDLKFNVGLTDADFKPEANDLRTP